MRNLEIKCDSMSVEEGAFREPKLLVKADDVDLESLISQIAVSDILKLIDVDELVKNLIELGYEVEW